MEGSDAGKVPVNTRHYIPGCKLQTDSLHYLRGGAALHWTTDNLRDAFLNYFASKDHRLIASASLNPASYGDATTLLTTAGMQSFVPYFKGEQTPPHARLVSCQKSCRSDDLAEVGYTSRHHTFFEMLGNFSFGDYFKREAIEFGWEFITDVLGIAPGTVWATIYQTDDEADELWQRYLPAERIARFDKKDNWWGPVGKTGPCGPCSEMHMDRGAEHGCGADDCRPNCPRCERYLELWNLVFQQFNQQADRGLPPLPAPGVDTGMGLERLAALMQGVATNHEIDIIAPIVDRVDEWANGTGDVALPRIIADHARAVTFLAADGIVPSNEGRGYAMRRILRRAARVGRQLGLEGTFLHRLVPLVVELMKQPYPELVAAQERIVRLVQGEEQRFGETLEQGSNLLDELMAAVKQRDETELPGAEVFRLYDTYGFPRELTEEIAREHGLSVDDAGFEAAMATQRERARAGGVKFDYGEQLGIRELVSLGALGAQPFVGYERIEHETEVVWVGESDDETLLVLAETPFYGESGGQVGDVGQVIGDHRTAAVTNTIRDGGLMVHLASVEGGPLQPGEVVRAVVDADRRRAITRAHSATHLLHAALRKRLGTHVAQAGSLVEPDRLRFDFSHFGPLSDDDLRAIEKQINEKVLDSLTVETLVDVPIDDARKLGAMMLFGEKYGDRVRVVRMGAVSTELCGGTHTKSTSQIGLIKLVAQSSVGANLRRVEAVTGMRAWEWVHQRDALVHGAAQRLNVAPDALERQVEKLLEEQKRLQRLVEATQQKMAASRADELVANAETVGSLRLVATATESLNADALRTLADEVASKLNPGVVALGSVAEGKVVFIVKATADAVKAGAHAGNLVREVAKLAGGSGGGRPDFAQAGGKDASKLREALSKVMELLLQQLK